MMDIAVPGDFNVVRIEDWKVVKYQENSNYRKSSFKPPVLIKPPYSNKPPYSPKFLNKPPVRISPGSNKPPVIHPGAYLKYTVLVRGLIRVPCKRVNHVAMAEIY